jgi:hypothetical protein
LAAHADKGTEFFVVKKQAALQMFREGYLAGVNFAHSDSPSQLSYNYIALSETSQEEIAEFEILA